MLSIAALGLAEMVAEPQELAAWVLHESAVAIPEPTGTMDTVVSELSFSPWVDVQARNRGELQGDISLRGGTFEGTGFVIGGLTIFDPQTGHYAAEIPVDPAMLTSPEIALGAAQTALGFNASAGSVSYGFSPVVEGLRLKAAAGSDDFLSGSAYAGQAWVETGWSSDLSYAYSESDSSVEGGSHELERFSGRVQWSDEAAQFDLLAGYQDKAFQWPYLYALQELHDLIGTSGIESEQIETALILANYERELGESTLTVGAYYRENKDDYEFAIETPGLFNDYQHTTEVFGTQANMSVDVAGGAWTTGVQFYTDSIESTSLVYAPFTSRDYWVITSGWQGEIWSEGRLAQHLAAGIRYEDTSEDKAAWSPYARWSIDLERNAGVWQLYVDLSQSTKVAGYTAIGSNDSGGLFRGNQSLGREYAKTAEAGLIFVGEYGFEGRSAVFYRDDEDLVDWTFESGSLFARRAENVDIETYGLELFASGTFHWLTAQAGYTYITKDENYGADADRIDGSFYALNYARHRATLGLSAQITDALSVLWDQEYRVQADNELRSGAQKAWFHTVAVGYALTEQIDLRLSVDNLLDEAFEEVPGVPGAGRSASVSIRAAF